MKNIFVILIFIAIGYFIYRNFIKFPYRYVGFFYPNIDNMEKWIESEPFNTLESCREWAAEMEDKYTFNSNNYTDYECGKDCYKGDPYFQGVTYTCNSSLD